MKRRVGPHPGVGIMAGELPGEELQPSCVVNIVSSRVRNAKIELTYGSHDDDT